LKNKETMNVLELKGSIIDMVALMQSPTELTRLRELIKDFITSPNDYEAYEDTYQLSPEQEAELDEAIQETYDPSKLTPHSEVLKMMDTWLKE
jgi:hypothetical protein